MFLFFFTIIFSLFPSVSTRIPCLMDAVRDMMKRSNPLLVIRVCGFVFYIEIGNAVGYPLSYLCIYTCTKKSIYLLSRSKNVCEVRARAQCRMSQRVLFSGEVVNLSPSSSVFFFFDGRKANLKIFATTQCTKEFHS